MIDVTILVNKNNLLDKNFVPDKLFATDNNEGNFHNFKDPSLKPEISSEIVSYVDAMLRDAKLNGFNIIVDSGYRSYDYQLVVYNALIKEKGEEAFSLVAPPGSSEHQTGLAIDIAYMIDGKYSDDVKDSDEEVKWMKKNSYKYGFILRYPQGKEDITGYSYEPWHYRFVGLELAKKLYEEDKTLEEYYELKRLR